MTHASSLTFSWSIFGAVAAAMFVGLVAVLAFMAWRRSGYLRGVGILEGLRVLVAAAVALALFQPEWVEEHIPDEKPAAVVLWDSSRSMETRDIVENPATQDPPKRRLDAVTPIIEPSRWESLGSRFDIVIEPFSSSLPEPPDGTDLEGALSSVTKHHANVRGIVLLSDGDWNVGGPPVRAAARLRVSEVPVFTVGIGSETRLPDIELSRLDAPTFGVAGKPIRIPFLIDSAMAKPHNVSVTLTPSIGSPIVKTVNIPPMGRLEDSIVWTPERVGDYELSMKVPAAAGELTLDNNELKAPINIRQETIKVLLVESLPRWEYRYLRNALLRDPGVDVNCLLFHPGLGAVGGGHGYIKSFPDTFEALAKYDVIFLGDVGTTEGQLTAEQCRMIKGLVQSQAGGLILMPGMAGRQLSLLGTELESLFPVTLDSSQQRGWGSRAAAQFELTTSGRTSLLTKLEDTEDRNASVWESLPGFHWFAAIERAKAGSEVLATHRSEANRFGRIPLLVTKTFGTGKILFMGTDGAWRWREGVEDKYHYRFWGQVARWMAYQRNMAHGEFMRIFYSPDRPHAGGKVALHANVMSMSGEPLQSGNVVVLVTSPSGKTESVRLSPSGDEWGLFSGEYTPNEPGDHTMTLTCRENNSTLEAKLAVQKEDRERMGRPARYDVLEEIAAASGGKMVAADDLESLLAAVAALPNPEPVVRRTRIWCHPAYAAALIVLLSLFWVGRKLVGVI